MNKFVVVSDIHFPFQDDNAIKAFFKFLKEHTVDTIILNGDIMDCYDVSRFDKDISRTNSLQREINLVNKFFSRIREINPEAKVIFIKGNHCDRIERYLKKHNELFSLDVLKIPNLLNLEKFNIEYYDKFYKLGSLKITHGSVVRKFSGYTAHAEMDKNDCSGISGHTHRLGAFYKKTPARYLAWFEGGCLCDINPEYVDNPDWQQGFIYGAVDKDSFTVEIVPILEGKIKKII